MNSLLILNGPNLNLLGTRQPEVYGHTTLSDIDSMCKSYGATRGCAITCAQSNHEGMLVSHIHEARGTHNGIVLNAGAYTHTSIALMDAIKGTEALVVEVHLSNVHAREPFRHTSFIAPCAIGVIAGFGAKGYLLAIDALLHDLEISP